MSRAMTRRSRSDSGTSLETIRWASPSTIAVLPTPGSPISTGLFFVRRLSTWITRRISSSRPITGSSLPCSAMSVRSRPKRSSGLCSSCCAPSAPLGAPSGGVIVASSRRQAEGRANVGGAHELSGAIRDQLRPEGAAHLLELLGEAHLRLECLQLDLLDVRVHALDLLLETELGCHLLDAPEPVDVLLGVQPGALGRALRLDQPSRLVHAKGLRVHLRELGRDGDHEHAPIGLHLDAGDCGDRARAPATGCRRGGGVAACPRHQLSPAFADAGSSCTEPSEPFSNRPARGLPPSVLESASTACSCSLLRFSGTSITKR